MDERNPQSQLKVKRQLFHKSIRKQQLENIFRKKRQAFIQNLKRNEPQSYNEKTKQKKKIEMFMVELWTEKLKRQDCTLEAVNQVALQLQHMNLRQLCDTKLYMNSQFEAVMKLLTGMLQYWMGYLQLVNNNPVDIIQLLTSRNPILSNLTDIFTSIIHQQDYQQKMKIINHKRSIYIKNSSSQHKGNQQLKINREQVLQSYHEQEQKINGFVAPSDRCWEEVRAVSQMTVRIILLVDAFVCANQQESAILFNKNKNKASPTDLGYQCEQLFTLISLVDHPAHTPQLFQIYLKRFQIVKIYFQQSIDKILESIYNFITNPSLNSMKKDGQLIINYSNKEISTKITNILTHFLEYFTASEDALAYVCKICTHIFIKDKESFVEAFINSGIIQHAVVPYVTQRQQILQLWKNLQKKSIQPQEFIQKYINTKIDKNVKIDILSLINIFFNYTSQRKYLTEIFGYLVPILQILHYEMRQLGKINAIKKGLFENIKLFDQKIKISHQQDIIEYVVSVLRNMLGVTKGVSKGFIEKHGVSDLLVIWQHMVWLQQMVKKDTTKSYEKNKLQQSRRTRMVIVDCLYNITLMLTSQYWQRQSLAIFVDYKHSGVIKLLLHHIKYYTFNEELLCVSDYRESLFIGLTVLERLLGYVFADGYSLKLVDDLEYSGNQFGGEMMRQMLTVIFMRDGTFGKQCSRRAEKCLQISEQILRQCSLQSEQYHDDNREPTHEESYGWHSNNGHLYQHQNHHQQKNYPKQTNSSHYQQQVDI